jgi:hypothetical protein
LEDVIDAAKLCVGKACAGAPCVEQPSIIIVVAQEQRPEIRPRALGVAVAYDDELFAI